MKHLITSIAVILIAAGAATAASKPVIENGRPAMSVVVVVSKHGDESLMNRAASAITGTVKQWSGVDLPVSTLAKGQQIPSGPAFVLATIDALRSASLDLAKAEFIDDQGFVCVPRNKGGLFIVSRTARGVYNGAVYVRDFLIDGQANALSVDCRQVCRTPWMHGRAVYLLNIWGHEQHYTAADWNAILDSFARDGFETVYFWTSGHFPSKKFPQTWKWRDGAADTTTESRISTVKDLAQIIDHGHSVGLKMYLGGGLGGWTGTGNLTFKKPETMKTGKGIASESLCPSNQVSRAALIGYYKEMFDALPRADGVYIEMADEFGECTCDKCSKPVDSLGSRQFGQSQLTLVQEIARSIWENHPQAAFAFTDGYAEHRNDPAFYEGVKQMSDPRFEWMEARESWDFPGPNGKLMPAPFFSRKQMKWNIWEVRPLATQVENANRIASEGWYGMVADFSPGSGSGTFCDTDGRASKLAKLQTVIPFPTDELPYVLTYFVTHELMWEPTLTIDQVKQRVQSRFFGAEAPAHMAQDLWDLREITLATSTRLSTSPEQALRLAEIESHIAQAGAGASPKTLSTLAAMTKAIALIRTYALPPGK